MFDKRYRGLFIPANPFENVRYVTLPYDLFRQVLDCRLLEYIYPQMKHEVLDDGRNYIMIGDEEARLCEPHALNPRATWLFGYTYPLAGDMMLFEDTGEDIDSLHEPVLVRLRKAIIIKGEFA